MTRYIHEGFSDTSYEPVAQTFFGFRAFKVCSDGVQPKRAAQQVIVRDSVDPGLVVRGGLRGIFMSAYQWGDGHNEAVCLRGWPDVPPGASAFTRVRGQQHQLMLPDCQCGFWAYTNGAHVLSTGHGPAALGVIEGWGRMVLGPDGFRAEKARIVGVAFPDVAEATLIDSWQSRRGDSLAASFAALGVALTEFTQALRKVAGLPPVPVRSKPVPPARVCRPWERVEPTLRRAVERAYPSARLFPSIAAMLTEFPLSDVSGLLPKREDADGTDDSEQAS